MPVKAETPPNCEESQNKTDENRSQAEPSPEKDESMGEKPLELSDDATTDDEEALHPDTSEGFVMYHIISHKISRSRRNNHAKCAALLYCVHWYNCGPADDTWEPTAHLSQSKTVSYYKNNTFKLPTIMGNGIGG